jgi:hypothetical protein
MRGWVGVRVSVRLRVSVVLECVRVIGGVGVRVSVC